MSKTVQVYIFYLGMQIVTLLPRWLTVLIAKILTIFALLFARKERLVLKKNLIRCGQIPSLANVAKIITNYTICLSDLLRIPILDKDTLERMFEITGKENLTKTLALGRGAILITGHIGNWDLAGVYVASLGFPLTAVVEEIPGQSDLFNLLRSKTGMEILFTREKDKMASALHNNRILVLLGDRDITGRGIAVKFLSGEKTVPRGPAGYAVKYNAPIIFGYVVLNNVGKKVYRIEISEPVLPDNKTHEELAQIIADRLSEYIRQYPFQWFVNRDEWIK
jgi:KDO2-lipid IV(A) lauroyltransferase